MRAKAEHPIFVFGSNLAGRHGAGAAKTAQAIHGAIRGQAQGLQGFSYAIPTKSASLQALPLNEIAKHVEKFLAFAVARPELLFYVTRIGCGLAGYCDNQIAPMFAKAGWNVKLCKAWEMLL